MSSNRISASYVTVTAAWAKKAATDCHNTVREMRSGYRDQLIGKLTRPESDKHYLFGLIKIHTPMITEQDAAKLVDEAEWAENSYYNQHRDLFVEWKCCYEGALKLANNILSICDLSIDGRVTLTVLDAAILKSWILGKNNESGKV